MNQHTEYRINKLYENVLLILCLSFPNVLSLLDHLPSLTGTALKGPSNQSVHIGHTCRLQCQIQNRARFGLSEQEWKKTVRDTQLHVQWIIDGFGVTNETLKSVYDERYHMPGPISEGIYDLVISDVRLEDEASFICQANVKLYQISKSPLVETLTSQPALLTVVVPPKSIILQKPQTGFGSRSTFFGDFVKNSASNSLTISWSNSTDSILRKDDIRHPAMNVVADDPGSVDANRNLFNTFDDTNTVTNQSVTKRTAWATEQPADELQVTVPVVWVKENEQLNVECRTTFSKPAAQIVWVLAGVYLHQTNSNITYQMEKSKLPSSLSTNGDTFPNDYMLQNWQFYQSSKKEKYEIENKQLFVPFATNNFLDNAQKETENQSSLLVTVSTLRITIQRYHRQQLLQCRINNTKEFLVNELPTVSAIIEPMYVEKIHIETNNDADTSELREGSTVEYRCSAITNPPAPIYRWKIIRADLRQMEVSEYLNYSDGLLFNLPETHINSSSDSSILRLRLYRDMHRSRIVCWVGVRLPYTPSYAALDSASSAPLTQPGQANEFMTWEKKEQEIQVLYGATFEHMTDNLRSTQIGHITTIDCSVDSNPSAQISLYRLGKAGQKHLEQLSAFEMKYNQSRNGWETHVRRAAEQGIPMGNELSPDELSKALESKGTQMLASASKKISYPLQISKPEDFGFYVCVARNAGFSPAFRHVLVGEIGPPKIYQCQHIRDHTGQIIELVCLIHSIPRPTMNQVQWIRNGIPLRSNKRLRIYHEQLIRGTRSALHFRNFLTEDISEYNFTVANEYGTDWQVVSIANEGNLPLVFVVGSGAATILAVIFVTIIGCFIRHTRLSSTRSTDRTVKKNKENNGLERNYKGDNYHSTCDTQLQPIAQSNFVNSGSGNETKLQQTCHFCLTAQNPAFLDTQLEMDDALGGGTSVNCKKSDDSGYEPGDVTSIRAGLTDQTFWDHTPSSGQNPSTQAGTLLVRNSPIVCYSATPQYSSTSSTPQFGNTFTNFYTNSHISTASDVTCTGLQSQQQNQFVHYGTCYGNATYSQSVNTRPLSPILFLTPSVPQTNLHETPIHSSEMILPPVIFHTNGLIASPIKSVCSASSTLPISSQNQPISTSAILTAAPYIYPDLSLLPLRFAEHAPNTTATPVTLSKGEGPVPICQHTSGVSWRKTLLINSKSSDDDSTNV